MLYLFYFFTFKILLCRLLDMRGKEERINMIRQNRLIAAILSAVLVFSMVPSGVLAAEETVDSSRMEIESEGNRQSEETEADMSVSEYEEDSSVLTEAAEGAGDDAALSGAAADEESEPPHAASPRTMVAVSASANNLRFILCLLFSFNTSLPRR